MMPILLLVPLLLPQTSLQENEAERPVATVENWKQWRDVLLPAAEETRFEAIPWRPAFGRALVEASAAGQPLLFWAMNGHPLGCT